MLKKLYDELQRTGTVSGSAEQVELVRRVARQVAIPDEVVGVELQEPQGLSRLITEERKRIQEGSRRLMQAMSESGRRLNSGDRAGARQILQRVLAMEVVPFYREIVEEEVRVLDGSPEVVTVMPCTLEMFRKLVEDEYRWLCKQLGLRPVPIHVYLDDESGYPFPRYGGEPRRVEFPMSDNDLSIIHVREPTTMTPLRWDKDSWEVWRMLFWHEIAHQYQDQHGFGWDPNDSHKGHSEPTWSRVMDAVAARVGCPEGRLLHKLLESDDTGPYSEAG